MRGEQDEHQREGDRLRMAATEGAEQTAAEPEESREDREEPDDAPVGQHFQPVVMGVDRAVEKLPVALQFLLLRLIGRRDPAVGTGAEADPGAARPAAVADQGPRGAAERRAIVGAGLLVRRRLRLEALHDRLQVGGREDRDGRQQHRRARDDDDLPTRAAGTGETEKVGQGNGDQHDRDHDRHAGGAPRERDEQPERESQESGDEMWAALQRILARATDMPERERERERRVQIEVHPGMVAAHERAETAGVVGHRIAEDRAG